MKPGKVNKYKHQGRFVQEIVANDKFKTFVWDGAVEPYIWKNRDAYPVWRFLDHTKAKMIAIGRLYYLAPNDAIYQNWSWNRKSFGEDFVEWDWKGWKHNSPSLSLRIQYVYNLFIQNGATLKDPLRKTASHEHFMIIWVVSKPMVIWGFPSNCLILICRHCQAMFEDCCGVASGCFVQTQWKLAGGFNFNPPEKYARQIGFIFPK